MTGGLEQARLDRPARDHGLLDRRDLLRREPEQANAQISSPLSFVEGSTPGTGGFIETPLQRLGVRHVFDRLTNPEELGKVPVEGTGGRLRLTDVTTVVEDHQPLIGDAVVNDADGLLLIVEKFPGANTLDVTGARFPSDGGQAGSAGGADLSAGGSR